MNILQDILCVIGGIIAAAGAALLVLTHKIGKYIEDIYDDDMFWGGKE